MSTAELQRAGLARRTIRIAASVDRRWVAAGAVFAIVTTVYSATLLRGVTSGDGADMQTVPAVLGSTDPTGYPLWTLLGFLFARGRISLGGSSPR